MGVKGGVKESPLLASPKGEELFEVREVNYQLSIGQRTCKNTSFLPYPPNNCVKNLTKNSDTSEDVPLKLIIE